jgi:hypothetical protein
MPICPALLCRADETLETMLLSIEPPLMVFVVVVGALVIVVSPPAAVVAAVFIGFVSVPVWGTAPSVTIPNYIELLLVGVVDGKGMGRTKVATSDGAATCFPETHSPV